MQKITLLGIPLDLGAENLGVDIGPNAFRYQHIVEKLNAAGLDITDHGNITTHSRQTLPIGDHKVKYLKEITRVAEETAQVVHEAIKNGEKVVALGGDHSITLGTVSGAAAATEGKLGLIYFDTHGDMNTHETTLTGNIHGMQLASLMGFGHDDLKQVYGKQAKIQTQNLLHIGGNDFDFDQAELDLVAREKLQRFSMMDLLSNGLRPLWKHIDTLQKQTNNIWISLDLDVIDSIYAPGAGMRNNAGLSYREITNIAGYIGKTCNVVGVDVVEYNPLQDIEGKTAELATELIAKFLGVPYSWYSMNYMVKNKL